MRLPGDAKFALGPHVDGGSVERWDEKGYGLGKVYDSIWKGQWEDFDPWEASCRLLGRRAHIIVRTPKREVLYQPLFSRNRDCCLRCVFHVEVRTVALSQKRYAGQAQAAGT